MRIVMADTHKFLLRMPRDLAAKLEGKAREENRSLNAQIVTELQKAVKTVKREQPADRLQKGLK